MEPQTIVVIQLRQLGDILLTTPAVRALKKKWPHSRLIFVSHSMGKLVLSGNPYIDEHLTYSERFTSTLKIIRNLRKLKPDLLIDYMFNPRSALISLLSGAKYRVSFQSKRAFAYHKLVPRPSSEKYIVSEKLELLDALGVEDDGLRLDLSYEPSDLLTTVKFLESNLSRDSVKVVISPTHRRVQRRWPLKKYAAISDFLTLNWQAEVIWVWGPGEEDFIVEGLSYCEQKAFKAPKTSFRELAALLANVHLFIGNSNGPSHVAVSTGICSVQLHGHTLGYSWCPNTVKHQFIQAEDFGKTFENLDSINTDQVVDKLEKIKPTVVSYKTAKDQYGVKSNWADEIPIDPEKTNPLA